MSFVLECLRDFPVGLFAPNQSGVIEDASGYGKSVTTTGAPALHAPLFHGGQWAAVLNSTTTVSFESTIFKQGMEQRPFSLAAIFKVTAGKSEQQVIGNNNQMDGIVVNGTVVSFVVKFADATAAIASFDLGVTQTVFACGVYSVDKITLMINGEAVDSQDITESQTAAGFSTTTASLYSGQTAGGQSLALGMVALYPRTLDGDSFARQYTVATLLPTPDGVVTMHGGDRLDPSMNTANMFLRQTWTSDDDWNQAELNNVAVVDSMLRPQFESNISVAGQWLDSFALDFADAPIYGVAMFWDGFGVSVDASLDGVSWESVIPGKKLSIISETFDATEKELQVRVSFSGGTLDDESYIDNLTAIGILSNMSLEQKGRTLTYSGSTPSNDTPPQQMNDLWGVRIETGGSVSISPDTTAEATVLRTMELWVRRDNATDNPLSGISGTQYFNGQANAGGLPVGQWTLVHIVFASDQITPVVISGAAQIGSIGIFSTALSAAEISAIFDDYFARKPVIVSDTHTINTYESPTPVKIYAHEWSIQSSG